MASYQVAMIVDRCGCHSGRQPNRKVSLLREFLCSICVVFFWFGMEITLIHSICQPQMSELIPLFFRSLFQRREDEKTHTNWSLLCVYNIAKDFTVRSVTCFIKGLNRGDAETHLEGICDLLLLAWFIHSGSGWSGGIHSTRYLVVIFPFPFPVSCTCSICRA